MEIQESRTTFQDWANKHNTFYVKEPQCKIHEYQGSIHITLLEAAGDLMSQNVARSS